jgi:hypothetical protein
LLQGFTEADRLYDGGDLVGEYYPGQTVAPQSNLTTSANSLTMSNALKGNAAIDRVSGQAARTAAGDYLGKNPGDATFNDFASGSAAPVDLTMQTASGAYLNSNPYLDEMYGKAAKSYGQQFEDQMLGAQSAFAKAGRYGSGGLYDAEGQAKEKLATGLGDLTTDIYGGNYATERGYMEAAQGRAGDMMLTGASGVSDNYNNERNRMIEAMQLTPALEEARYIGSDKMAQQGQYQDDYLQQVLDSDVDRWDSEQNAPYTALQRFMGLVQGNYGGTSSSKSKKAGFELNIL